MPSFDVDDQRFWEDFQNRKWSDRVEKAVRQRIEKIKIDPSEDAQIYGEGKKWGYYLLDTLSLIVAIDEKKRIVRLLGLLR